MSAFETWLSGKLQELETDEGVFLPYIVSILEGEDETEEEKKEGLTGILADCLDNEEAIEAVLNDIMDNWKNLSSNGESNKEVVEEVKKLDITAKMHEITQERLANSKVKTKEMTEEEKKIKEAVLNSMQNGAKSDDEEEDAEAGDLGPANTNAAQVQQVLVILHNNHHACQGKYIRKEQLTQALNCSCISEWIRAIYWGIYNENNRKCTSI